MSIEITFIRHGETDANAASIWQGQGDAALSDLGRRQAVALRDRIDPRRYDVVVSSDLARTMQTADLAGLDPQLDPAWREMDIGEWEGLTRAEVHAEFPEQIERLASGDQDVAMGGGESWSRFGRRIADALDRLVADTPAGSRVLIMAHGGVIHAALSWGLGFKGRRPWPVARILNTAITEVIATDDGMHLQSLNDARHAPVVTGDERDTGDPVVLIRHGESVANTEGRWHGRTDGPLTERGRAQAEELGSRIAGISRVFASPLERTRETAAGFARSADLAVELVDDLVEIDFGAWEGMTTSEIEAAFPEEFERFFGHGVDLPRGGTGETFAGAAERIEGAVRKLAESHPGRKLALFTHGGAIWAFASRIMGIDWTGWRRLAIPSNASTSHVRVNGSTPVLVDYNLSL